MSFSRAACKLAFPRRFSRGVTGPLGRLLPLIPLFALALPACQPTVIGCEEDSGGAAVPDGSFEEQPTQWTLAPHSTVDDQLGVCGGKRSLRVELDQGLGPAEVTRSAPITGAMLNKEYEVTFHYRFENCRAASLAVNIGNYVHRIDFEGSDGTWGDTSIVVQIGSEPTSIDIHPERAGAAEDYAGAEFENNLMWVDDFTLTAL